MARKEKKKQFLLGIRKLIRQKIQEKVFQKFERQSDIQKVFECFTKLAILGIYLKSQEIGQEENERFTNYKN